MKWEDILKISAGERSDAERFADPKDMLMNDSELRKFTLEYRKKLKYLMDRPKEIKEKFKSDRGMPRMAELFMIEEAKVIMNMNLNLLDKKLKNLEEELNKDSPNMFKLKRMQNTFLAAFRDAIKPLRELRRERDEAKNSQKG